jgi:CheY-like chemotaxis protein
VSVLAVCRDLFFTSRIGQTGKLVGTPVEFVQQPEQLPSRLLEARPDLAIVDLTTPGWDYGALFAAVERHEPRPAILGFTTHALAGSTRVWHERCDRVVTKETLTQELADILAHGLAARPRA